MRDQTFCAVRQGWGGKVSALSSGGDSLLRFEFALKVVNEFGDVAVVGLPHRLNQIANGDKAAWPACGHNG